MNYTEIKTILSQIHDPAERLEFVMDLGREIPPIPANHAGTEIRGCASRVEIFRDRDNNYYGSADSAIVRGVLTLLLSMVQGKAPSEIRKMNLAREFASLNLSLGAGRMNGVAGTIAFLESDKVTE
ncbi:MAG: SufE family protein [Proteobacteria bacterium]|nr:SufE family protein [Pseudomonadota bacterium]